MYILRYVDCAPRHVPLMADGSETLSRHFPSFRASLHSERSTPSTRTLSRAITIPILRKSRTSAPSSLDLSSVLSREFALCAAYDFSLVRDQSVMYASRYSYAWEHYSFRNSNIIRKASKLSRTIVSKRRIYPLLQAGFDYVYPCGCPFVFTNCTHNTR